MISVHLLRIRGGSVVANCPVLFEIQAGTRYILDILQISLRFSLIEEKLSEGSM